MFIYGRCTDNQPFEVLASGQMGGEGFAKFPTIDDTAYTEQTEFKPDEYKDSIFFSQKTWYKNETPKNGHTVFWDIDRQCRRS